MLASERTRKYSLGVAAGLALFRSCAAPGAWLICPWALPDMCW